MKRTVFAGLLISAAMLASPAFAADKDLCAANIQKIDDFAGSAPSLPESSLNNIKDAQEKAKKAQAAGDDKQCLDVTSQLITKMQIRDNTKN